MKISLAEIFNQEYQIYDKKTYKYYFYKFCSKKNTKFQDNLIKFMKEKFEERDFETCIDENIVYIYTFKNKIVYIGETFYDYNSRFNRGYKGQLFGQFAKECNFSSKNKDWKFYVYHPKNDQSIKELESYLINWFATHDYPTLNSQCENRKQLLNLLQR